MASAVAMADDGVDVIGRWLYTSSEKGIILRVRIVFFYKTTLV